jgi:integrase
MIIVEGRGSPATGQDTAWPGRRPVGFDASSLWGQFPPRPVGGTWQATAQTRDQVMERLLAPPFVSDNPFTQKSRRIGLITVLDWLQEQPGHSWQERWVASGADAQGNSAWRHLPAQWLRSTGRGGKNPENDHGLFSGGLRPLIWGDVLRPSMSWLLTPGVLKKLAAELAAARDPDGFATLASLCDTDPAEPSMKALALSRIAVIVATKGGTVRDITVGDCLELLGFLDATGSTKKSLYLYQLLHAAGVFPAAAPPTVRVLRARGQLSAEQMIDRYAIVCRPVRDLLVEYLRERQSVLDYASLHHLADGLGRLFWRDLEIHHPGIDSLRLPSGVATAWKQRVVTKKTRTTTASGEIIEGEAPRSGGLNYLAMVRAFYLDIAQWAIEDPARWGPWAAPCPIREEEMSRRKDNRHRKSRIDQRTRERLPVLPVLVTTVDTARKAATARLETARHTKPGEMFTAGGQTLRRSVMTGAAGARIWAEDPEANKRRDLTYEEHQAFWTWAAVEVLRHTGIRIEELTELSHHSFVQYRLPTTGELVPLLQIAPSKTDAERLLVIAPELADVLSAIICRIRDGNGAVPLVVAYDPSERVWNPAMPLLFQRRLGLENRPVTAHTIRQLVNAALAGTGLADASGQPLRFAPHDFRRIFVTDAVMNGMPPHIAQVICGHRDINTTMGYKAVYPEEVINGHRAFIARRRATRPSEEYRTPTDTEWDELLGHFERRKVAYGTCGRSFGTGCIHEHACIRCPMLRPDPAQRSRLLEVRDNLLARIAEAEREGWRGEVEGLRVSLAATRQKLAQANELAARRTSVDLGMPDLSSLAGRTLTTPDVVTTGREPS